MEPWMIEALRQLPWVVVLILWRWNTEERKEWRAWFEEFKKDMAAVIAANTAALTRDTLALGEVTATVQACEVWNGKDRRKGGPREN